MNLIFRELRASRKSLFFWCIGIAFLIVAGMTKFSNLSTNEQALNDLMSSMPKSLQVIFGTASLDLSTVTGYYSSLYSYLLIMAAIHTAMLGASIIAKEESDKTAEFLLAKPISRVKIVSMKLVAALIQAVIFNVVSLVISLLVVRSYGATSSDYSDVLTLLVGLFLLQLFFLSAGMGMAAKSKRSKSAASRAASIMLVTYVFSVAVELNDKLEPLKYLTPFKYFDAKVLLFGAGFEPVFLVISIVFTTFALSTAFIGYRSKDITI